MNEKKLFIVTTVAILYITISLACDPLSFRLVSVYGPIVVTGSGLIYAALYTLLDVLTRLAGRTFTIKLILIFHLSDLLFTYLLYGINLLPAPASFHKLHAYNVVIQPIPIMFWAGLAGALIAGIVEVLVYAFLQKRIKSFFWASFISTMVILLAHNLPTDIIAFKKVYPHIYLEIVAANFAIGISLLIISIAISTYFLKRAGKKMYFDSSPRAIETSR